MNQNIVYKITHLKRLEENTPPFYYIGSKYKWKGEGTYFGSCMDSRLYENGTNVLKFEILSFSITEDREDLLLLERDIQLQNNVLHSELFFNRTIAHTYLYALTPESLERRINNFKKVAYSKNSDGKYLKDIWAELAKEVKLNSYIDGIPMNKAIGLKIQKILLTIQPNGQTLAKTIYESKVRHTFNKINDDGKTLFDICAEKLSKRLLSIDPETGLTYGKLRAIDSAASKPVKLLGKEYNCQEDARKDLNVDKRTLVLMLDHKVKPRTYKKLLKRFTKEQIESEFELIPPDYAKKVTICGQEFESYKAAMEEINISEWSFLKIVRGEETPYIINILVNYFGKDKVSEYYDVEEV